MFYIVSFRFTLVTLNCNGLRDAAKRLGLLQWLSHLLADVVCLEEAHVLSEDEGQTWFSSHGFSSVCAPGSSFSCGTIVIYRSSVTLAASVTDAAGRLVVCTFVQQQTTFRVFSVYAPNSVRERGGFFRSMCDRADPAVPSFLCGDFNAVFDEAVDRRGAATPLAASSRDLRDLFYQYGVEDIWRVMHPSVPGFTWHSPDGSQAARLDYIGVPDSWVSFVSPVMTIPCPFSDHCGLMLRVTAPCPLPRGPGRWKMNVSLLTDGDFLAAVECLWAEWRRKRASYRSVLRWWDDGKQKLKGLCIPFGVARSRERAQARTLLSNLASHLQDRVDRGHASEEAPLQGVLTRLAELDLAAAKGAQVRARCRWAEEGESSTSFFFRLERRRGAASWIPAVRDDSGSVVADLEGILTAWRSFYQSLFSAEPVDLSVQDSLLSQLCASLSSEPSSLCEGPLTVGEVRDALQGMARGKAPGSDGLPADFYQKCWHILGGDLVDVLNFGFREGRLSLSQRTGQIALLFKKGDRLDRRNWRPVTLLNADYNLCARALAGRLRKVMHHVVHPDQTCGIPGRFIGENVALLRDVVHFADDVGCPAAILSLDQEKAFDRVDWLFLFKVLERMGFGPSFVRWVQLLYSGVRNVVLVNGYASPPVFSSRGVRQGCPLSPMLGTLRYGDYGLRTTDGTKIRTGTRHVCSRFPPSQAGDGV